MTTLCASRGTAERDAEAVAGHHYQVEGVAGLDNPVELTQRVVEVGDEEDAHRGQSVESRNAEL